MDFSITDVPFWVSVTFMFSFVVPVWLIAQVAAKAYRNAGKDEKATKRLKNRIIGFYTIYLLGVAVFSLWGAFAHNTLPPPILLFTAIPLFAFYLGYVRRSKWFKLVLSHSTMADLVWIHIFRLVGVFFFINYFYGVLPKEFAIIGGSGDVLTALLAFGVVSAINQERSWATSFTWIWNFIGVLDILSVLFSAIVTTRAAIAVGAEGVAQFGTFPFSWIPAFAPATILFLHLIIFEKLIGQAANRSSKTGVVSSLL